MAQIFRLLTVPAPFVMMYDFLGLDAMTNRRTERLGVYFWNLVWSLDRRLLTTPPNRGVIIGEADDIPDIRLGPLLPNRREHAHCATSSSGTSCRSTWQPSGTDSDSAPSSATAQHPWSCAP